MPTPIDAERLVLVKHAFVHAATITQIKGGTLPPGGISAEIAAANAGLPLRLIRHARAVLLRATPAEIQAIEDGSLALSSVYRQIVEMHLDAEQRIAYRATPLNKRGANNERRERRGVRDQIWAHLKAALTGLTNLPAPADVAAVVRRLRKQQLVDTKLTPALLWLGEFSNVWSQESRLSDRTDPAYSGDGRQTAGVQQEKPGDERCPHAPHC